MPHIIWFCNTLQVKDIPYKGEILSSQPVPWMESQLHLVCHARPHQLAVLPIRVPGCYNTEEYPSLAVPWGICYVYRINGILSQICVSIADVRHRKVMTTSIYCPIQASNVHVCLESCTCIVFFHPLVQGLKQGTSSS